VGRSVFPLSIFEGPRSGPKRLALIEPPLRAYSRSGSLRGISSEYLFPKRDNVGSSPRGSSRADFDGPWKFPAFASSPPSAFANGNEGKNLRQAQQRVFVNVDDHDKSPCGVIFLKCNIGFFLTMLSGENCTTG
jgi:hypothetical protein